MEIIPSIIGRNIAEVKEKIEKVQDSAKWVQIDVMDGIFVPTKSWPYTEGDISDLEQIDTIRRDDTKIDVHLMIENPESVLEKWVEYGADRIVFHCESTKKITEIIKFLHDEEVEACIALKFETPINVLEKYLGDFDAVQFMDIKKIGEYGQKFEGEILDKIREVKEKYPGVVIEVDGGVNLENIESLKNAGVENFVVGSAIFGEGKIPTEEIRKLQSVINSQ